MEETEFIKRMMTVYEDKEFDEEILGRFDKCEVPINRHSTTLVLICVNKLYEILLKFALHVLD